MKSKKTTCKKNFYLPIIQCLKQKKSLQTIQKELNISKQQLNYYLRQLKKKGFVSNKDYGWWELTSKSKNSTKYHIFLKKDLVRGHAYVWNVKLPKKIEGWNQRLHIIKRKGINYKLVGAKETTPRIKVLGRKVWLCNDHIRIFDTEKSSYYGENAIESRKNSSLQLYRIVRTLENKLGFMFKPFEWSVQKEHYALIKNDLAIDNNQKGIIMKISDEDGEWLLTDDSLGQGGELENVGKKALQTNIPMQKWWNDNKKNKFQVTPTFVLKGFADVLKIQEMHSHNIVKHQKVLDEMLITLKKIQESLTKE